MERSISNRLAGISKCNHCKPYSITQPFEVEKITYSCCAQGRGNCDKQKAIFFAWPYFSLFALVFAGKTGGTVLLRCRHIYKKMPCKQLFDDLSVKFPLVHSVFSFTKITSKGIILAAAWKTATAQANKA